MTVLVGVVVYSHQRCHLLSIYLSDILILRQLCSLQESHNIDVERAQGRHSIVIGCSRVWHAFLHTPCMSYLLQQLLTYTFAVLEYLKQRAWSKNVAGPHDTNIVNDRHLVLRVVCQVRPYKVQPIPCTFT